MKERLSGSKILSPLKEEQRPKIWFNVYLEQDAGDDTLFNSRSVSLFKIALMWIWRSWLLNLLVWILKTVMSCIRANWTSLLLTTVCFRKPLPTIRWYCARGCSSSNADISTSSYLWWWSSIDEICYIIFKIEDSSSTKLSAVGASSANSISSR